jgi:hypothetical protein
MELDSVPGEHQENEQVTDNELSKEQDHDNLSVHDVVSGAALAVKLVPWRDTHGKSLFSFFKLL